MKLVINNIGKIGKAEVEINGITVIAGENNTGKSTIGKVLFALFNCMYDCDTKIYDERKKNIERLIHRFYRRIGKDLGSSVIKSAKATEKVIGEAFFGVTEEENKQIIKNIIVQFDERNDLDEFKEELEKTVTQIWESLNVSDEMIFKNILEKYLGAEFNDQIVNIYNNDMAGIELDVRTDQVEIQIDQEGRCSINKRVNFSTEAVYVDDPFVLDAEVLWLPGYPDHRTHLKNCIWNKQKEQNVVGEIVAANKLDAIYEKLSGVCEGEIIKSQSESLGYKIKNSDKVLDAKNLSTGLKTFAILKVLLMNGSIEPNGTIILDEPEIHLHPEWQLLFAELIVLLCKEFDLHILMNTHSPYFLNAIEVYSVKYGVDDKCKYYLAYNEGSVSLVEDVTSNIDKIYRKLAAPLQRLENERYSND